MPPKSQASKQPSTLLPSSASPPTALIWAHQLRRENNALLGRIHALEKSVKAAVEGVEGERRREGEEVGRGVALLERRVEDLEREVRELREGMATPRRSKRACVRTLTASDEDRRTTTPLVVGTQQRFESIELGSHMPIRERSTARLGEGEVPVSGEQDEVVVRDSMATQTPSDMTPEIPESPPDNPLLVKVQIGPQRGVSEHTHASMGLGAVDSQQSRGYQQSRGPSSMHLVQSSLSLLEYLQLGEEMRARFPGRRQEGRVVEAFWEGMNDGEAKRVLEEKLEKYGWVWEVVGEVCGCDGELKGGTTHRDSSEKGGEVASGTRQGRDPPPGFRESKEYVEKRKEREESAVDRKLRRRRSIFVVPIDNFDEP